MVTNKYWLPLNKRKVVFDNFGGRGYGDNPKYIADELLKQDENLDLVWV
ncbi:CDP-glycerol glycerophosphotransferase family protein, partial [Acinetobacter baumannii]